MQTAMDFREHYEASFPVGAGEPVFAGHFPGNPILPGVFTLALVRETVRRGTGRAWRLGSIQRHKLVAPVVPGVVVTVQCRVLAWDGVALSLHCDLTLADGHPVATARLRLEPC